MGSLFISMEWQASSLHVTEHSSLSFLRLRLVLYSFCLNLHLCRIYLYLFFSVELRTILIVCFFMRFDIFSISQVWLFCKFQKCYHDNLDIICIVRSYCSTAFGHCCQTCCIDSVLFIDNWRFDTFNDFSMPLTFLSFVGFILS